MEGKESNENVRTCCRTPPDCSSEEIFKIFDETGEDYGQEVQRLEENERATLKRLFQPKLSDARLVY